MLYISYYETFPITNKQTKENKEKLLKGYWNLTIGQVFHCASKLKHGNGNCAEKRFTLNNCPTVIALLLFRKPESIQWKLRTKQTADLMYLGHYCN